MGCVYRPASVKKADVRPLEFPADRRILVISDIHGNLPFFRALLNKAKYVPEEDVLVLLGDLVEKGPESLATLRAVMEMTRRYEHVYPVCGNCDNLTPEFVYGGREGDENFFLSYLSKRPESLVRQMGAEVGTGSAATLQELDELRRTVLEQFQPELRFIETLPTILRTEHLLFVHGGVPSEEQLEELPAWGCMKNDYFRDQNVRFSRFCIVGHTPVTLYGEEIQSARPLVDREQRLISIDGGCILKRDGQLNALIIPNEASEDFGYTAFDGMPVGTALDDQKASFRSINIRWGRNKVEVLEWGEEFSLCRHLESGYELWVLTDYLYPRKNYYRCEDTTDYKLPVKAGDRLAIVQSTSRGYLAKRNGVTGWYGGRLNLESRL